MITLTFKYKFKNINDKELLDNYIRQYTSCLHVVYNFIKDNKLSTSYKNHIVSDSDLILKLRTLKHVDLIIKHYYLTACVIADACDLLKSEEEIKKLDKKKLEKYKNDLKYYQDQLNSSCCNNKRHCVNKIKKYTKKISYLSNKKYNIVFGGRKNFIDRCKGLITHKEFIDNKLSMIYSKGSTEHFNRLFSIIDENTITFKPTKDVHIELIIPKNKHNNEIRSLIIAQQNKELPCTFRLGKDKLCISYDPSKLNNIKYCEKSIVSNRVMSIDINPNYIGWCITDWKSEGEFRINKNGVFSIKDINDEHFGMKNKGISSDDIRRIHLNNKRTHEIFEISKKLINICLHYRCETFSVEDVKMNSDDKNKGKNYNSLCNNLWCRTKILNNLKKRCDIFKIEFIEISPDYSSFVGNFLFRSLNLPDMILAAFELTRRTYQFKYNNKLPKENRKHNILFPDQDVFKHFLFKSLEEFGLENIQPDLKTIYYTFKKAKTMYRLSLDSFNLEFNRFYTVKSKIKCYQS